MEKKLNKVKLMCLAAVMAALYVGLDFLAVSVSAPFGGNLKISLSGLPVIVVAIFGGTFNPPHLGHRQMLEHVSGLSFVDEILVIPTKIPIALPYKKL